MALYNVRSVYQYDEDDSEVIEREKLLNLIQESLAKTQDLKRVIRRLLAKLEEVRNIQQGVRQLEFDVTLHRTNTNVVIRIILFENIDRENEWIVCQIVVRAEHLQLLSLKTLSTIAVAEQVERKEGVEELEIPKTLQEDVAAKIHPAPTTQWNIKETITNETNFVLYCNLS